MEDRKGAWYLAGRGKRITIGSNMMAAILRNEHTDYGLRFARDPAQGVAASPTSAS